MGHFSMMHWIVVGLVVLVLFGRGKISETMGDFGKGIRSFKRGLADEEAVDQRAHVSALTDARPSGSVSQVAPGLHKERT